MSEQAFSKARSHFNHLPFEKMVQVTTQEEYHSADTQTWNGYYLFAIDGTTMALLMQGVWSFWEEEGFSNRQRIDSV